MFHLVSGYNIHTQGKNIQMQMGKMSFNIRNISLNAWRLLPGSAVAFIYSNSNFITLLFIHFLPWLLLSIASFSYFAF